MIDQPLVDLRLGTRGSALALAQTHQVIELLQAARPGLTAAPVVIKTEGDIDKSTPLTVLGGRGVFTSSLQQAVLAGSVALAVHCAKDLPTERPPGLVLAAYPVREDPRDVIVSRHGVGLAGLPRRPAIGTSSRRRMAQLRQLRPDAVIVDLRGNIDTRLRRAASDELDAIVLAAAGIHRMGWSDRITQVLEVDEFVPSPGQGALVLEARAGDPATLTLLDLLNDPAVATPVQLERAFLSAVGGGCTKPIAAFVSATPAGGWRLRAMLADDSGDTVVRADTLLDASDPATHVGVVANELLARLAGSAAPVAGKIVAAGAVADAAATSRPVEGLPLAGQTVLVTRPRAQAAPLVAALQAEGATVLAAPAIRIEPVPDSPALDRTLAALSVGDYDWVAFTSANAVEQLTSHLARRLRRWPDGRGPKVAAVGPGTAAALAAAGIPVDLVPAVADAEGLAAELMRLSLRDVRLLFPRGDQARDVLPARLRGAGAQVDVIDIYRTVPESALPPAILARLRAGGVGVVTFASPSSVRGLVALAGGTDVLAPARIICVGSITAAAARAAGLDVAGVAADPTVDGLVAAVLAVAPELTAATVSAFSPGSLAPAVVGAATPGGTNA